MTWLTQNWTSGQLNALVKIIGEKKARDLLSGKDRLTTTKNALLKNRQEIPISGRNYDIGDYPSRYLFDGTVYVTATDDFKQLFADLTVYPRSTEITLVSYDLAARANPFSMRGELSEFHVFENPNKFCWILSRLLPSPENHYQMKHSKLLTEEERSNLFFVKVKNGIFTVGVHREGRQWIIRLEDETGHHPALHFSHRWNPENYAIRVFDRNEAADPRES